MTDPSNVVPFGKYKGRLIEELLVDDPGYVEWLAGQEWFRAKFTVLHQVIINRGAEPEETPEHNAMQVRFLDDEFCRRFLRNFVDLSPTTLIKVHFERQFEMRGIDVVLTTRSHELISNWSRSVEEPWKSAWRFNIELKPAVGDDYPAILRQMKRLRSDDLAPNFERPRGDFVLLIGAYTGRGATEEQFVTTFDTAGIRVVFSREIG